MQGDDYLKKSIYLAKITNNSNALGPLEGRVCHLGVSEETDKQYRIIGFPKLEDQVIFLDFVYDKLAEKGKIEIGRTLFHATFFNESLDIEFHVKEQDVLLMEVIYKQGEVVLDKALH